MPIISTFFGILVKIYYREHGPPRIHVEYQGYHALVSIDSGKILGGDFPPALRFSLRRWIQVRKAEILADWELARQNRPLLKIPGLDQ